jgi:hypothetical protein
LKKLVTAEDAVARMINMDYIPTGFTILDMTAAFLEEAEVDHQNAVMEILHPDQIAPLRMRMEACKARHSLAKSILDALNIELEKPAVLVVKPSDDYSAEPLITFESLSNWATEKYGIGIADWQRTEEENNESKRNDRWEGVTIKIYKNYRIGLSIEKNLYERSTFQKIGLMRARKFEPNLLGGILIGMSNGKKFPAESKLQNKDAAAVSKLRSSLKQLTGISTDPFTYNKSKGYKPRFKLVDDRRNSDDRAKEKAWYEPIDETRDYEKEDGDAADWLAENA